MQKNAIVKRWFLNFFIVREKVSEWFRDIMF